MSHQSAPLSDHAIHALQKDKCPVCEALGLRAGPRGGESQNVFCDSCKTGFNVALPRMVFYAEIIPWSEPREPSYRPH